MKKKEKKPPIWLFNDEEYKYPKGLLVETMEEYYRMLETGWNTGPVDAFRNKDKVPAIKEYLCPDCNFTTKHEPALKAHITREHKE